MKLNIRFRTSASLRPSEIAEMWALYQAYYDYSEDYFYNRIERNTHFVFFHDQDQLVGFSGLRINRMLHQIHRVCLFYFGQGVIHHDYRGKNLLRKMGIRMVFHFWKEILFSRCYFWCDAVSFKSYLAIAKGMDEYYPHYQQPTPKFERTLINRLGRKFYGEHFCESNGTVHKPQNFVSDPSAQVKEEVLDCPEIAFYTRANPGYQQGNGLITITPMNGKNMRYLIQRILRKRKKKGTMPTTRRQPKLQGAV